ncbi:MAG: hypothetical protein EOO93_23170, partial [Pedobacter sp.]
MLIAKLVLKCRLKMNITSYLKHLIIGLALITTAAFGQISSVKHFKKDSLEADALLMLKSFEEVQVNSYFHISKSELLRKKDSIFNSIPAQVDQCRAFTCLSEIAALISDSHTYIDNYAPIITSYEDSQIFPLTIGFQGAHGLPVITNNLSRTSVIKPGAILMSINGFNAQQLFHRGTALQGGLAAYKANEVRNNFSYYLHLFGIHAPFIVEYTQGKIVRKETLPGIGYKDFVAASQHLHVPNFSFKFLSNNIGYINFNTMSGMKKFKMFLD